MDSSFSIWVKQRLMIMKLLWTVRVLLSIGFQQLQKKSLTDTMILKKVKKVYHETE